MAKFKIEWPDGRVEEREQSDCESVEQLINCRFGAGVKPEAKITLATEGAEAPKKTTKK